MGSRIITGLKPDQTYLVQVRAISAYAVGAWCDVVEHKTQAYPVPNMPTNLILELSLEVILGRAYNVKCSLEWSAPTNIPIRDYEIQIWSGMNGTGTLQKTLTASAYATKASWTDADPDTDYSARIRAVSKKGDCSDWTLFANHVAVVDATPPTAPTVDTTIKKLAGNFIFEWTKCTEIDMKNYNLYIATSSNSTSSVLMKKIAHPTQRTVVIRGNKSVDASITISWNTTYWWWLSAEDIAGNESDKTSFLTGMQVEIEEFMKHLTTPWQMMNITNTYYTTDSTSVDSTTYTIRTIPNGKVGLFCGYDMSLSTGYSLLGINHSAIACGLELLEYPTTYLSRSPQFTNGLYLSSGDYIYWTPSSSDKTLKMRVVEFDADENITSEIAIVSDVATYTVPSGERFVVTYGVSRTSGTSGNYLQKWESATTYENVVDLWSNKWDIGQGVLQFSAGTVLKMSTGAGEAALLFGVLLPDP